MILGLEQRHLFLLKSLTDVQTISSQLPRRIVEAVTRQNVLRMSWVGRGGEGARSDSIFSQ